MRKGDNEVRHLLFCPCYRCGNVFPPHPESGRPIFRKTSDIGSVSEVDQCYVETFLPEHQWIAPVFVFIVHCASGKSYPAVGLHFPINVKCPRQPSETLVQNMVVGSEEDVDPAFRRIFRILVRGGKRRVAAVRFSRQGELHISDCEVGFAEPGRHPGEEWSVRIFHLP